MILESLVPQDWSVKHNQKKAGRTNGGASSQLLCRLPDYSTLKTAVIDRMDTCQDDFECNLVPER